jgi:hypothetical protein
MLDRTQLEDLKAGHGICAIGDPPGGMFGLVSGGLANRLPPASAAHSWPTSPSQAHGSEKLPPSPNGGVGYTFNNYVSAFGGWRSLKIGYRNGNFIYNVQLGG